MLGGKSSIIGVLCFRVNRKTPDITQWFSPLSKAFAGCSMSEFWLARQGGGGTLHVVHTTDIVRVKPPIHVFHETIAVETKQILCYSRGDNWISQNMFQQSKQYALKLLLISDDERHNSQTYHNLFLNHHSINQSINKNQQKYFHFYVCVYQSIFIKLHIWLFPSFFSLHRSKISQYFIINH